jgi:putative transposase
VARSRYKILNDNYPYFHTCSVVGWLPVFTRPETVSIVLDSFTHLQVEGDFTLYGYVIMENHLHFVSQSNDHSNQIRRFKSYTARKIIDYLQESNASSVLKHLEFYRKKYKTDSQHQFWQEGTHPQQISSEEVMQQKLEYLHYNPVKRGYVDDALHWRRSSARNYAGLEGLIEITTAW